MFHPQDVPNYFTGSFRLAADEPRDNPLFYLIHTPDGQPTLAIEQPEENHIFEGTGLTSNYSIRADVNSTAGPDVNQVTFLIHKNNDSSQVVYLPGAPGEPTFSFTGAVGEYDTTWNSIVESDGNITGIQPYQVNGDSLGHDKFVYQQNFSELNLPSGEHTLIVRVTDVNGNSRESDPRHFTIRSYPVVVSTSPAAGTFNIPVESPIKVTFDHEMNTSTVESAVTFSPSVSSSYSWSSDKKTVTITPVSPGLSANTTYTVTVSDYAKDAQGNQLDGNRDGTAGGSYTFTFSTKPANIKIISLSPAYNDGQYWVKAGTKTVTVQLVDTHTGNAILTNNPPRLTWTSPTRATQPVNFGSSGASSLSWTGTISVSSGMNGRATFTGVSAPVSGNTTFMIDTKKPEVTTGSASGQSCNCPNGAIAFTLNPTDSGSGLGDVTPVGLGMYANGCFAPGAYQYGASSIKDNVGNTTSFVRSATVSSPPGCDHPDDNYAVSGSPLPESGTGGQTHAVIGLREGYHLYFSSLMSKVNQGVTLKDLNDFAADMGTPRLLVIPSAGLYGLDNSRIFRGLLDQFVKQGGTLLVFAQQHGYEYAAVPTPDGKPLAAYGWIEDQSCQHQSSYIDTWHQMLSSISQATPSINVDGYFTSYPETGTVILRRVANGQPSLIMYPHGNGRVIATALYSDFAYGYGQASQEEISLVRDMIAWAAKPEALPEIGPGQTVSAPVTVTNTSETDAASIKLMIHDPDRKALVKEEVIAVPVPAGASAPLAVQYSAPAAWTQLGIYHVDYSLLDAQNGPIRPGVQMDAGRFAVSNPPKSSYESADFNFVANSDSEYYPYGSDIPFTVTVYNNTDVERTIFAKYFFPHHYWETKETQYGGDWGSPELNIVKALTIAPKSSTTFTHIMMNARASLDRLWAYFSDENQKQIGQATRGFYVTRPTAAVGLKTDKAFYGHNSTVNLAIELQNKQSFSYATSLKIKATDPTNAAIYNTVLNANLPPSGMSAQDVSFVLPSSAVVGSYSVVAEAFDINGNKIGAGATAFELTESRIAITPNLPAVFVEGANIVSFVLDNRGELGVSSGSINVQLKDPDGVNVFTGNQPFTLEIGENKIIDVPVPAPSLKFGAYTITYVQSDETRTGLPSAIDLPNGPIIVDASFDKYSYRMRDLANMTLEVLNAGKFELGSVTALVSVPDTGFTDTRTVELRAGSTATLSNYLLPILDTIPPGRHAVNVTLTLPSGDTLDAQKEFAVPESSLTIEHTGPALLAAGDAVSVTIANTGGTDTTYSTKQLTVIDGKGNSIYADNSPGALKAGESKTLAVIQIPPQTADGLYVLTARIQDQKTEKLYSLSKLLRITGITATLQARTGKDVYLKTEGITALSALANGQTGIESGTLKVSVLGAAAGSGRFEHFLPKERWWPFKSPPARRPARTAQSTSWIRTSTASGSSTAAESSSRAWEAKAAGTGSSIILSAWPSLPAAIFTWPTRITSASRNSTATATLSRSGGPGAPATDNSTIPGASPWPPTGRCTWPTCITIGSRNSTATATLSRSGGPGAPATGNSPIPKASPWPPTGRCMWPTRITIGSRNSTATATLSRSGGPGAPATGNSTIPGASPWPQTGRYTWRTRTTIGSRSSTATATSS